MDANALSDAVLATISCAAEPESSAAPLYDLTAPNVERSHHLDSGASPISISSPARVPQGIEIELDPVLHAPSPTPPACKWAEGAAADDSEPATKRCCYRQSSCDDIDT